MIIKRQGKGIMRVQASQCIDRRTSKDKGTEISKGEKV